MGSSANPESVDGGLEPDAGNGAPGSGRGDDTASNQSGAGAGAPGTPEFDRNKLNPVLRSMSETELNEVFDTLLQTVRQPQQPVPEPQTPAAPPPEPDYKDLLDPNSEHYNPRAAFQGFVQSNYGGLLGDINQRSMDAVFLNMAHQLPDFREHEDDIRRILRNRDPLSLTQMDVLGTYYAVKGAKHTNELLQKKRQAAAAGTVTGAPSPPKDEVPEPQISEDEKRVAQRMFPRSKDPVAEYKKYMNRDGIEMKVPIGGGKFA